MTDSFALHRSDGEGSQCSVGVDGALAGIAIQCRGDLQIDLAPILFPTRVLRLLHETLGEVIGELESDE